jgi:hypothetical protein
MMFEARRGKGQAKVRRSPVGWSSIKVMGYSISSLASAYVDRNADLTSQTVGGLEAARPTWFYICWNFVKLRRRYLSEIGGNSDWNGF